MKTSEQIKLDFPLLQNQNIAYLDNAATSQKPKCVIDAVQGFYCSQNANAHRGTYQLAEKATELLETSRQKVADFVGANAEEIVFTKNATEALNLIAYSYGFDNIVEGDEIVLSIMEHHSMIVPFQRLAEVKKAKLKYLYLNDNFEIDENEIESKITTKTKIVGIVSTSNVLGTKNNIQKIIQKAHNVGAVVVVDITQSIAHEPFDVKKTDVDFAVFSGHKMYAPLGVGVLYGKKELLNNMKPFLSGGDMIEYVYEDHTTFAPIPNKFEAGTQDVGAVFGLATAVDYIKNLGYQNILKIETELRDYALQELKKLDFVELYVTNNLQNHSSVISFNIKGVHPHDVATILSSQGVCIRAGNHCAQPLLRFLGLDSTCRISFAIYNTKQDVDRLVEALKKTYKMFKKYI